MPHMSGRTFISSIFLHSWSIADRKKYAPPYYIIYLFIFQINPLLLPTLRSAHISLLSLYHNFLCVSNSRSAEVPFLNIISYLIQFVKFRSICRALDRRRMVEHRWRGRENWFAMMLEERKVRGRREHMPIGNVRSAGPDRGFGIQGN